MSRGLSWLFLASRAQALKEASLHYDSRDPSPQTETGTTVLCGFLRRESKLNVVVGFFGFCPRFLRAPEPARHASQCVYAPVETGRPRLNINEVFFSFGGQSTRPDLLTH